MFKVYEKTCKNCLLSPDAIVSPEARKDIIKGCEKKQTYFICHKASMNDQEICCRTFYDKLGHISQMIRIAERLNYVEFVPQTDTEKLPTWKEMNGR